MATSLEGVEATLKDIQALSLEQLKPILEYTPIDQPILLVGIHGIGKSEFIKEYYTKHGYGIITLFLGQAQDAGDLIGLPDRSEVEFCYGEKILKRKITEFCPPVWWPRDDHAKIVLFLDEFNRGKQEIYQCIMDMALNRRLNGLDLPPATRIIAAMNPLDDEYGYQVTEIDPALWDRFNVYGFSPMAKEWIRWAIDKKIHKNVIGFITKHNHELDPPANGRMGVVYPSRRSWERVSTILKNNPKILNEEDLVILRDLLTGIVGAAATTKFYTYVKENNRGLNPGKIITAWDKKLEEYVKNMSNQDRLALNAELAIHLEENEKDYFDVAGSKQREKYAYNVYQYLKTVPREIMGDFYNLLGDATTNHNKTWGKKLIKSNIHGLVSDFLTIYHGDDQKEPEPQTINPEDHFGESDGTDDDNPMDDPDIKGLLGE